MNTEKIDQKSRAMLAYLNTNLNLTSATLAEAFNQHYKLDLQESMATLSFLANRSLVEFKSDNNKSAIIIQVTHLGRTYEQSLLEQAKECKKKLWSDRRWNIATLFLSALISFLTNFFMK